MRRVRLPLIAVLLPLALIAAAGCGVTADTTAATVAGQSISVESVDALARSAPFDSAGTGVDNESVLDGTAARSALGLQVQAAAAVGVAERLGLKVDDAARADGEEELSQQIDNAKKQGQNVPEFGSATRKVYVDLFAAYLLLGKYFASAPASAEPGLRHLYDAVPDYWSRICITGVTVPATAQDAATSAFAGGAEFDEVLSEVDGAEQIADAATDCVPRTVLPANLLAAVDAVPTGKVTAGVVIAGATGTAPPVAFLRVDRTVRVSFADAREELTGLVSQAAQDPSVWTAIVAQTAEINPRYGSGVAAGGSGGQLAVLPPPAPVAPASGLGAVIDAASGANAGTDTGQ